VKTVVLKSIREIAPAKWNAIVGRNRLICRHEYLLAVESSGINDCRYFYPVVYDDSDNIMAHTCLYYISTELDSFTQGIAKRAIMAVRRIWKSFLILRSIECGTPVALGNTISFAGGVDKKQALAVIVRAAESVARMNGVNVILFRDFLDAELDFFDQLRERGFRRVPNLPAAGLSVRWPSFDAYLQSLRSPYRHIITKRSKAFRLAGCAFREVQAFDGLADCLANLWQNTYEHATEYRRERLHAAFFRQIKQCLGARASVLLVERAGVPVAFSLLLDDDDTLITLFCGLDYTCSRDAYIYFNLFYKSIEVAIRRRKTLIDFGITTLVPKVEVGGHVVPLTMYMKCTLPVLGLAIPSLFDIMTPDHNVPERQIFRGCDTRKNV
jgi:predicted N-acyltransferase